MVKGARTGLLCVCALASVTGASGADEARQVKVLASVASVDDVPHIPITSDRQKPERGMVFRSPAELAAKWLQDETKGQPPAERAKAEGWAAKLLKVERIDWDRQMLLGIDGGTSRFTREVQVASVKTDGKVMTVTYRVPQVKGQDGINDPRALLLVPRFEGAVRFVIETK